MKKFKFIGLFVLIISTMTACVTTTEIGLNRNFSKGNFIVGKTTKSEVVDFLGLPQKIEKGDHSTERFIYPGEALITNVMTGSGNNGHVFGLSAGVNEDEVENGAVYTFSQKGILINKHEPKEHAN